MEIKFIGTGGAFDWQVGNSAAALTLHGKRILLDCGHSVFPKLMELGIADSFDALLLTHLHDDHAGSASTFLYAQYFLRGRQRFPLIAPTPGFQEVLRDYFRHSFGNLDHFVEWVPAASVQGLTVLDTTGLHFPDMPTFGFLFQEGDETLAFSGDIGDADFVFAELDARGIRNALVFHDLSFHDVPPHAHYTRLAPHAHRHRLYGYHHNPDHNPPDNPIPLVHHTPQFRLY